MSWTGASKGSRYNFFIYNFKVVLHTAFIKSVLLNTMFWSSNIGTIAYLMKVC